ncbi:MAG: hypothetical protein ACTHLT_15760 [Devosia sp.]
MSNNTGKVIAVLLALILAVLLFGRDAVTPWLWVAGVVLMVGCLLWLVWRFLVFAYGDEVRKHFDETRAKGGSILLAVGFWIGCFLNAVVLLWAGILALNGVPFKEAFLQVPLFWVPLVLMLGGYFLNEVIQWWKQRRAER